MDSKTVRNASMALVVIVGLAGCATGGKQAARGADDSAKTAAAASADVECPQLVQAKYPFITCHADAHGNVLMNSMGAPIVGERLPERGSYADKGDGHWGPMR